MDTMIEMIGVAWRDVAWRERRAREKGEREIEKERLTPIGCADRKLKFRRKRVYFITPVVLLYFIYS